MKKIKSMTCTACGSPNVAFCLNIGWMDKDFKATNNEGPFGEPYGTSIDISEIAGYIKQEQEENSESICICECYGECRDECDVNIVMEDGTIFNDDKEYYSESGECLNTGEAVLMYICNIPVTTSP